MYTDIEKKKAYHREYYQRNKDKISASSKRNRPGLKEKGRLYLKEYLESHPCVDCGISDIRVLQFDHRDPDEKYMPVAHLTSSIGLLKKEVAKCDVRCANCHMIRTAQQFGWERIPSSNPL